MLLAAVSTAIAIVLITLPADAQRRLRPFRRDASVSSASPSQSVTITYQGLTRRYLLHIPHEASGALVLAFHGGSETPENQENISGFDSLSDRERFIVAYPEGIDRSWADGRGSTSADKQGIDDVGFAKVVVADVARTRAVDRSRVYATGPSNGGIFSNRLGCEAADTFVAIGPVIGTIASGLAATCHPSAPMSVVGVQGVSDPVVPFGGGDVGGPLKGAAGGRVESSRATQELWRRLAGCADTASSVTLPGRVNDGTAVTRRVYSGCRAGTDVIWYEIQGGGHRWPPHRAQGIQEALARRKVGISSQNINASATIWQFFAAHHR
jgi:polyhydroxybutyrate depolymerase